MPFEVELPAGSSVKLTEQPGLAQLSGGRLQLLDDPEAVIVLHQDVHARHVHIFIGPHDGAQHTGLRGETVLMQHMPGKLYPVEPAPVLNRREKIFCKQPLDKFHILPLHRADLFPIWP